MIVLVAFSFCYLFVLNYGGIKKGVLEKYYEIMNLGWVKYSALILSEKIKTEV